MERNPRTAFLLLSYCGFRIRENKNLHWRIWFSQCILKSWQGIAQGMKTRLHKSSESHQRVAKHFREQLREAQANQPDLYLHLPPYFLVAISIVTASPPRPTLPCSSGEQAVSHWNSTAVHTAQTVPQDGEAVRRGRGSGGQTAVSSSLGKTATPVTPHIRSHRITPQSRLYNIQTTPSLNCCWPAFRF